MAKNQTRRSVSIRGTTYERVRHHCRLAGVSMSEFVEDQIAGFFADPDKAELQKRVAKAVAAEPLTSKTTPARIKQDAEKQMSTDELQSAARVFTF